MDLSAVVAVLDGSCLSECHCMKIMNTREMGRATTIGSTAVHGGTIWVTLPKIAWQIPRGFASAAWKNADREEPDDYTGEHTAKSRFC